MTPIEEIKQQFIRVIQHSQHGIEDPKIDNLFDEWMKNKQDIIEAFGGKFIYELPHTVKFEITNSAKEDRIDSFIDALWELDYVELAKFLDKQRDGFFKNKVVESFITEGGKTVVRGTKLVKSFKYFIKDDKQLNDLQSKASQILQENKVEGKLCFSVHPLDYLSISENTYNWRSCHALDGEYRAGNLSYMMDNSTIVCYLKGEENVKLPNFPQDVPWNSKKWRVLLYLSNDWKMIFAGKQYPFSTNSGMKFLIDECFNSKKLNYNKRLWIDWTTYTIPATERKVTDNITLNYGLRSSYIPLQGTMIKLPDLVKDVEGSKQFNDVLRSSVYTPMYTQLIAKEFYGDEYYSLANQYTHFNIGNMTTCLRCGQHEIINDCSSMMCYDCEYEYGISENEDFGFCEKCNTRLEMNNAYFVTDYVLCESCYDEHVEHCVSCGDKNMKDNLIQYDGEYWCPYCWENFRNN